MTEAVSASVQVLPSGPVLVDDPFVDTVLEVLPQAETGVEPTSRQRQPDRPPWRPEDIVDEWGAGSFPASDPPANW